MSFRGNINGQLRGFYYASSGDDNFNGQTVEVPKRTLQAAIDEATALIPPPSGGNIALVTGSQGGSFVQTMVLTDFVQFNGEDTTLRTSTGTTVTLASGLRCRLENASNLGSGVTFLVDGLSDVGIFAGRCAANTGLGVSVIGTVTNIFVDFSSLDVTGIAGTGISITSTNTLPIDINIDIVMLSADNTTFIDYNAATPGSECVLRVSSVDSGIATGTSAFLVQNGILAVESTGDIRADSAILVKSGGTLRISGTHIVGSIVVESGGLLQINAVLVDGDITVESGATMTGTLGSHNGDITNDGDLNITTLVHVGTINNTGTINGSQNGIPGGNWIPKEEVLLTAFSLSTQSPTGTDAPLQIEFGAAQGSGSDPVQVDVNGLVTFNRADQYVVSVFMQYGRSTSGGAAHLYFRVKKNGAQVGNSIFAKLDGGNDDVPVQFISTIDAVATDTVIFELLRDSAGQDEGDLITANPTLGDWNNAPSAALRIERSTQIE